MRALFSPELLLAQETGMGMGMESVVEDREEEVEVENLLGWESSARWEARVMMLQYLGCCWVVLN